MDDGLSDGPQPATHLRPSPGHGLPACRQWSSRPFAAHAWFDGGFFLRQPWSWASGFVLGCLLAPRLVKRIGHVRAFSAFAAGAAIVALLTGLLVDPIAWIVLRALTGFSMAAVFMVIESWLNERSTNDSRGMVFSLYMTITYVAIVAGQMSIAT
jgi:MFS family permease